MRLSAIIPSYKDPFLQKTIDSLLSNSELGCELDVIVVLDGYWPAPPLQADRRVHQLHLGKNRGMREAINAGVQLSRAEYILRTDEHCLFGPGYDRILLEHMADNWIVTPRRFCLDPYKWEIMNIPPVDYNKLIIDKKRNKFAGVDWGERAERRRDVMVDETLAMQGSCWLMKRTWWDSVIGALQTEGYGPHYGDSHEMVFKTWQAGGKLMVNKHTYYAHKERRFPRTHNLSSAEASPGWAYAIDRWKKYYDTIVPEKMAELQAGQS